MLSTTIDSKQFANVIGINGIYRRKTKLVLYKSCNKYKSNRQIKRKEKLCLNSDRISDNSCGPINIEYPEYMAKQPSLAPSYLQGDTARFECFQTHWIKGDHEYKCSLVVDYNYPGNYRFEWNKGSQPWCRSREMDNFLMWLFAIMLTVSLLTILILIFLCCWCIKMRRRQEQDVNRQGARGASRFPRVSNPIHLIGHATGIKRLILRNGAHG